MRENILIVEDEESLRSTLGLRLRGEGYVVDTASDGIGGLEKATTQPFDLIILDIMLPDRSGWDVCRDIRQAGMAIPILILTARTQTGDKVVGLKLGADDYVTSRSKRPNSSRASKFCCGAFPSISVRAFISSAPFGWTSSEPK